MNVILQGQGVKSFNGRTGIVLPQLGDYTANIIQLNEDDPTTVATALGDKAPAGFGFGEKLVEIQAESADESYETFCAKVDAYAATLPDSTAALVRAYPPAIHGLHALSLAVIVKSSADYIVLHNLAWGEWRGYGWQMIRYKKSQQSPSVWMPFEWVNPPLNLGVEYRTTERYQGKPVYVQTRPFGSVVQNTDTSISITSGVDKVLRYSGHAILSDYDNQCVALPWNYSEANYIRLNAQQYGDNAIRAIIYSTYLISEAYVQVWYTKTTN